MAASSTVAGPALGGMNISCGSRAEEVYISQGDIRQIQLAKGAIASGIIMLLKELKIDIRHKAFKIMLLLQGISIAIGELIYILKIGF